MSQGHERDKLRGEVLQLHNVMYDSGIRVFKASHASGDRDRDVQELVGDVRGDVLSVPL